MRGSRTRPRGFCPRVNRGDDAHRDEDNHFAPRRAFGADDIDGPTVYGEHRPQILFFEWVTLTEHKWVTLGERRLARQHGVYAVAHPLRLDYTRLKKRLGGSPTFRRKATKPAFVELVAPARAQLEECVIEFESSSGSKMRIHWKATAPPDWTTLLQAWRETIG
jgi:hypothetical protein